MTDQSDAAWANYSETYHNYAQLDDYDRTVRTTTWTNGVDYAVSDYLYDATGKLTCTVQHMNPATWGAQASSCSLQNASGPNGPDRVSQAAYDADGRISSVTEGIGTAAAAVTATYHYTPNGKTDWVVDGNNNRTSYVFDGFDRMVQTQYSSSSKGNGSSNAGDYEAVLTYDANGNPTQTRLRDGTIIDLTYDNLGRMITRSVEGPGNASDYPTNFGYNLLGQIASVTRPHDGQSVIYDYDILGRMSGEQQSFGAVSYTLDLNGRRTAQTWSDGFYVNYDYDNMGLVTKIRENGANSGVGVLASYSYDNTARRTGVTYGNGTSRSYGYDPISRLTGLQLTFPNASGYNHTIGGLNGMGSAVAYTPSMQIASIARSNNNFVWTGASNVNRTYNVNGLNQYHDDQTVTFYYDSRGNLTSSGAQTFNYDKENQMVSGPNGTTMYYDTLGRLVEYDTNVSTRMYYSGGTIAAEIANDGTNAVLRRYVMGPGTDEPIVWYEGSGTSDRRFLQADERGSIIAVTDSGGNMLGVNTYDEYGIPGANNIGRFQYTGQTWYGEVGLYNFKARWYSPTLGRFMQTDPIGYGDGLNWHNYAHGDPVNGADPSGLDNESMWSCYGNCGGGYWNTPQDYGIISNTFYQYGDGSIRYVGTSVKYYPSYSYSALDSSIGVGEAPQSGSCTGAVCKNPDPTTWNSGPDIRDIVVNGQKAHGPWTYGNYCGAGGAGVPINAVDAACAHHDKEFGDTGVDFTYMLSKDRWNSLSRSKQRAVQKANQNLCDAMSRISPTIPAWNISERSAAWEIKKFFTSFVPLGAQCH